MKFRHEYKHKINNLDAVLIRQRLRPIARYDEHSRDDGTYFIKSLYFDNYMDKALREKIDGVDKREKFRIRYYNNNTSFIRLEKKSKLNGFCVKESSPITREQVQKLIDNDIDFLKGDVPVFNELYAKMNYHLLRPKNIVVYERECFVYGSGNVRVTLDTNVRGSYNIRRFLEQDVHMTQLYHTSILELKWDEYLPQKTETEAEAVGEEKSADKQPQMPDINIKNRL